MWPPETKELERQLLVEYEADVLVTKDSGPSGNLPEKWDACRATDTEMVVVRRPRVDYPDRVLDPNEAVKWSRNRVEA
jgi:precorrin-6A/cobalt-precorrin-6A reductase